jgi:hypothetical protein
MLLLASCSDVRIIIVIIIHFSKDVKTVPGRFWFVDTRSKASHKGEDAFSHFERRLVF